MILALCSSPALAVGFSVSRYGARLLDRGYIRPAIISVSGLAAVVTIVRYFL